VLGEEEGEVGFVEDWKFPLGGDAIVGVWSGWMEIVGKEFGGKARDAQNIRT
jgi:hypothetical protein